MHYYVGQSGNTGLNLLDRVQPNAVLRRHGVGNGASTRRAHSQGCSRRVAEVGSEKDRHDCPAAVVESVPYSVHFAFCS